MPWLPHLHQESATSRASFLLSPGVRRSSSRGFLPCDWKGFFQGEPWAKVLGNHASRHKIVTGWKYSYSFLISLFESMGVLGFSCNLCSYDLPPRLSFHPLQRSLGVSMCLPQRWEVQSPSCSTGGNPTALHCASCGKVQTAWDERTWLQWKSENKVETNQKTKNWGVEIADLNNILTYSISTHQKVNSQGPSTPQATWTIALPANTCQSTQAWYHHF